MLIRQGEKTINVAAIGMDDNGKSRISLIFTTHYKGQCKLTGLANADIALVDTHAKSDNELEKLKQFVSKKLQIPYIILGKDLAAKVDEVCIAHPPKLNLLWDNMLILTGGSDKRIAGTQRNGLLGDLKAISVGKKPSSIALDGNYTKENATTVSAQISSFEAASNVYFNLDDFLLGKLQHTIEKAKKRSCSIQLTCWDQRRIIVYPNSGYVLSDLKPAQLKNLGLVQVVNSTTIEISDFDQDALYKLSHCDVSEVWALPIEVLLWNLALRTSRGRLPQGTSLTKNYRLSRWPNFTRVDHFPHCMRIAGYWIRHPSTLKELAVRLNIADKYINLFYTAAQAIDLIDDSTETSKAPRAKVMSDKKRSLFASILDNLSAHRKKSSSDGL